MRFSLSILLLLPLCDSCGTRTTPSEQARVASSAAPRHAVSLPKIDVVGVRWEDGLQESEAVSLASEYFSKFVCGCGMPGHPKEEGTFWRVQLWGGYAGSDYGVLRLAKDGSEVLLEPPPRGFKSVTRKLLGHHGLR